MDYFFLIVAGFCSGVLLRSFVSFELPALSFIFILCAASYWFYHHKKIRTYLYVTLFLFAACAGAGRTMLVPDRLPEVFESSIDRTVSLEGRIVSDPDIRDTNQHVAIEVTKEGSTTVVLAFAPLFPSFSYGEEVLVSGTLQKPEPFDTDGGRVFDYPRFLAKDGVFATIPQARIISLQPPSGFFAAVLGSLYGAKHTFATGIRNALSEPYAALAEGLLTGGKQGLGKDLIEAFTISGLIQIVVLSGYNVMIIAEAVLRAFSFMRRRAALIAAGVAIIAFVIAAGSGSAALRAGLMACIALYARATGRTYDAIRGLFLALVLLTLWNPLYLANDPGFQLSFVATLGLILGTPLIEPRLALIKNAFVRDITATTLAAQIAVLPLLLYQTGNLSFVSVVANVIVTPVIPVTMALSFIAGLIGLLVPSIATVIAIPASLLLTYIVGVAEYAASIPLAHAIIPAFPFVPVILAYIGLGYLWSKGNLSMNLVPSGNESRTRSN